MKLCIICKIKKKNSEFHKNAASKDKLQSKCKDCFQTYNKKYKSTKEGYLVNTLGGAKNRAKNKQVAFDLDAEYLNSIATDKCPVFNVNLKYASSQKGSGNPDPHAAALDRVIPELGYVKGNVVFISNWANSIKSDATEVQLYAVADWLHAKRKEVLNAFKEQLAPVSEGDYIQGAVGAELGSVSTPWTWEDYDHTDDYRGATRGENAYNSAKEGGGDSMGHGSEKVGPPQAPQSVQDNGEPKPEIVRLDFSRRHLFD
jgi:hypothetical protein